MNYTAIGVGMLVVGVALVAVGVAQLGATDGAPATAAVGTSTSSPPTTEHTTSASSSTTSLPTTTTVPPSSTTSLSTTTTVAPSTTTSLPAETVEEFIELYRAAIEQGDVEFLFDRLHPVVLAIWEDDPCRAFIEREILALAGYRLEGEVQGPHSATYDTPEGQITVDQSYDAPISFTFQGQAFDTTGTYAMEDGQIRWFTECR